ncbi:MAG: hypothetical protein F6J95_009195 [Leptolyngbya sp. SIO1E4]|nr:hypothetical protein [Leptolyngbya sp. SIO1E4]
MARSSLLINKAHLQEDKRQRWVLDASRKLFHRVYLRRYFYLCPGDRTELARWRIVNAAARLSENIPEAQTLLAFIHAELSR